MYNVRLLNSAAWSTDGTRILTGGAGGTVTLWDAITGTPLFAISRRDSTIDHAALSWDGTKIMTVGSHRAMGSDPSTHIYFVEIDGDGGLAEIACSRAGRNPTHEEWQRYMGSVPYRQICPGLP